jgi:hypothetical protein
VLNSRVDKQVSQTAVFDSAIEYGKITQAHPAQVATRTPKTLRPIEYTGKHVKDEKRLFRVKSANADAAE